MPRMAKEPGVGSGGYTRSFQERACSACGGNFRSAKRMAEKCGKCVARSRKRAWVDKVAVETQFLQSVCSELADLEVAIAGLVAAPDSPRPSAKRVRTPGAGTGRYVRVYWPVVCEECGRGFQVTRLRGGRAVCKGCRAKENRRRAKFGREVEGGAYSSSPKLLTTDYTLAYTVFL